MKKSNCSKFGLCLLVVFTLSCSDKKLISPTGPLQEDIMSGELTVASAKEWFNNKINKQTNGRVIAPKKPLWTYGTQTTDKDGVRLVIVPVMVEENRQSFELIMTQEDAGRQSKEMNEKKYREKGFSTPQKLVMFKDSKGQIQTLLMKVVANHDYFEKSLNKMQKEKANNKAKDFDGMLIFQDWNETKTLEIIVYENGKLMQSSAENSKKNGKTAFCYTFVSYVQIDCCNYARTSMSCSCGYSYTITTCGSSIPSGLALYTLPYFYSGGSNGGGGAASFADLNISYKQNAVDNFLVEANQNGDIFSEDDRLGFIDNFEKFLQLKSDLLEAIRRWGSNLIPNLENKLGSIKQAEKDILANEGLFSTYKINLMLYVLNAFRAENIAELTMNQLGLNGSLGRDCPDCRGNAVKHASWIAFNCGTFDRLLAAKLGNAHESGESGISTSMDLHNNSMGLALFDIYGAYGAIPIYGNILNYGMPNNSSNGFKFVGSYEPPTLFWTKDHHNAN